METQQCLAWCKVTLGDIAAACEEVYAAATPSLRTALALAQVRQIRELDEEDGIRYVLQLLTIINREEERKEALVVVLQRRLQSL